MAAISRDDIIACINDMAPESLAEPWDNCGLAIGGARARVWRVLVCLDVTEEIADQAIRTGADMVVSHHPLIFKPLPSIVSGVGNGAVIYKLIQAGVDVYCAHTNVDKTHGGLNDLVAGIVGLRLMDDGRAGDSQDAPFAGPGRGAAPQEQHPYRIGDLPRAYRPDELFEHVCARLKQKAVVVARPPQSGAVGDGVAGRTGGDGVAGVEGGAGGARLEEASIRRLAVMCGSYGIPAPDLAAAKADAVLCGEIKHHDAIELAQMGMHVVAVGHHGSERFFVTLIEKWLKDRFPSLEVACAGFDSHPLQVYHIGCGQ